MARITNEQLVLHGLAPSSESEPLRLAELVASVGFESYTPYMGGDFQAEHYQEVEAPLGAGYIIPRSAYMTGYPTAKSLLGKMRWLARVTVAQALCLTSHREAEVSNETVVAWIKPAKKRGPLGLSLLPLIFGTIEGLDRRGRVRWRGLARLVVEPRGEIFTTKGPEQLVDDDYVIKGRLMGVRRKPGKLEPKLYPTRFALLVMGREKLEGKSEEPRLIVKGANLYPMKPGLASFKATLYMEPYERRCPKPNASGGCPELLDVKVDIRDVEAFAASLLIATPLLLGLGKGSTRGFGRFKPIDACSGISPDLSERLDSFCNHLKLILEPGAEAEVRERNLKDLLGDLVVLAWRALGREGEPRTCSFCGPRKPLIPRIYADQGTILARVVRKSWHGVHVKAGFKGNTASPINEALAAIGYASLKLSWKNIAGSNMGPGLNMHTWPLGLPRHQKFPGPCKCGDKTVRPDDNPLRTGYLIGRRLALKEFITTMKECVEEYSERYSKVVVWDAIGFDAEARRQSMLIAFPLPPAKGDIVDVAVLILPAADMMSLLSDEGEKHLYHAGPHKPASKTKPCLEPVVSVSYAASRSGAIQKKAAGVYGVGRLNVGDCRGYLALLENHVFDMFLGALMDV